MNNKPSDSDDAKLSSLLRESRVAPPLPPRFQENVWRRIADAEVEKAGKSTGWLEAMLAWLFQPRLALAGVATLIVVGALAGVHNGNQLARQDAQARYLAAVAPNSLR